MKKMKFWVPKDHPKANAKEREPTETATQTSTKRREQLRRAQRERKEAYIKSLENEVIQFRANEAKLQHEIKHLYSEISRLNGKLAENQSSTDISLTPDASTGFGGTPNYFTHSAIYAQQDSNFRTFLRIGSNSPNTNSSPSAFFSNGSSGAATPNDISLSVGHFETAVRMMSQTQLGIEFVLTLESPCNHHVQGDPNDPSTSSGHAHTVTAQLLSRAPAQMSQLSSGTQWDIPDVELERLLELAHQLPLSEELTPVQAWNIMRQHPAFGAVDVVLLQSLTQKLLASVVCHGFGAVLQKDLVDAMILDAFVAGRIQ